MTLTLITSPCSQLFIFPPFVNQELATSYKCRCGKLYHFYSENEAQEFIDSPKGKELGLVRYYWCERAEAYHVTTQVKSSLEVKLEQELHREMTTVKEQVIEYIKIKYQRSRGAEYKCSVSEIRKALEKKGIQTNVSTPVSALKREGIITELDETDPERKGPKSYLFTLTEILEEVTKPKSQGEENKVADKVPAQPTKTTPITVATNPFDKVNSQLGEILAKINGIATGYSQSVELLQAMRNVLTQEESHTLNAVTDARIQIMELLRVIVDEGRTQRNTSGPTGAEIAEAVNARLGDLRSDNSFIYCVREELDDRISKTEDKLFNEVTRILKAIDTVQVPSSVANSDDYREGIKEGIRLAAEMGLMVKGE